MGKGKGDLVNVYEHTCRLNFNVFDLFNSAFGEEKVNGNLGQLVPTHVIVVLK